MIDQKLITRLGLGTWQLGAKWGETFKEDLAFDILDTAYKAGIKMIDTADIYNAGLSEKAIGEYLKLHPDHFYVVTKCGRDCSEHNLASYSDEALENYIDASLKRLQVEQLDMVLLHCPPSEVYDDPKIFAKLEQLKQEHKIKGYGVSVEKVSEALKALNYGISTIEIIFNMFRIKPLEQLFPKCLEKNIQVIVRVPLASGLLSGKYDKDTKFSLKDHRNYNRNGESFDKGETFSGVDYELGLKAVEELKGVFKTTILAPYALRWILMHDVVSYVVFGASKPEQVLENLKVCELAALSAEQMQQVQIIYDKYLRASVHDNW